VDEADAEWAYDQAYEHHKEHHGSLKPYKLEDIMFICSNYYFINYIFINKRQTKWNKIVMIVKIIGMKETQM